jgi:hypothetical protein
LGGLKKFHLRTWKKVDLGRLSTFKAHYKTNAPVSQHMRGLVAYS